MIWFFTAYSFEKKIFEAYDAYMNLVENENDWVCFCDGDTAFLIADFGHQIKKYVEKYPDTGLFTSYASRCHYAVQVRKGTDMENPSILYHKYKAEQTREKLDGQVKEINRKIAGHLMVIQKKTWTEIRDTVAKNAAGKNILSVDTKISRAVLAANKKILLMRGIYIFHYCRLAEGFRYKKHIE